MEMKGLRKLNLGIYQKLMNVENLSFASPQMFSGLIKTP